MVIPKKFRSYLIFLVMAVLLQCLVRSLQHCFLWSLSYCSIWFIDLLQPSVFYGFVVLFYYLVFFMVLLCYFINVGTI